MADTKISAESAAATLDGTELTIGVQSAANVKITMAQIVNLAKLQKLSVFAATSSAELAGVISDETGSGALVFATSPTLVTPVLGVAAATSINKVAITAPATSATLVIADGKTLTVSNTLTFTGTDTSSVAFGAGGTAAYVANKLSVFAATTSAELAGVISDETGTGALVFATSPGFTTAANPVSNDGAALGTTALNWSDLFLATGAVINYNAGNVTITHSSGLLTIHAAVTTDSNILAGAASVIGGNGRGGFNLSSDGVMQLRNNGGTDFGRVMLGGATSSFPAIKRSGAALAFRLADDSADAAITAAAGTFTGLLSTSGAGITVGSGQVLKLGNAATTGLTAGVLAATTNASIVITDSAGQAYRIPCII